MDHFCIGIRLWARCRSAATIASLAATLVFGLAGDARASPYSECLAGCAGDRDTCIGDAHSGAQRGLCYQQFNACTRDCQRHYPTDPVATRIDSVAPLYGWSSDQVRISGGNLFSGLAVTIGGDAAQIISTNQGVASRAWDIVDVRVPTLRSDIRGAIKYLMVVKAGGSTFQFEYAYSPVIDGSDSRDVQASGPFLGFGSVLATVALNRETGQLTGIVGAQNLGGPFDAMPFTVACVFFNADGKPIGSMQTKSFTAPGVSVGTSGPRTFDANWVDFVRPATGLSGAYVNQTRYAVVHISVRPEQELDAQVQNMVNFGKTMSEVLKMFITL
jgi:hypothetical protein